jgi:hypothetical protein
MDMPDVPERSDSLHDIVAVSVAILAAFMAVTKVKDDNIVQAMLQAKSDAVDTWGEYQAKKIKQHVLELGRDQAILLKASATAPSKAFDEVIAKDTAEIERYKKEETELRDKAKKHEAEYDTLNYRDDQFDLSDAALSVCLALFAVTALTGRRWLLGVAYVFAGLGVLMGLAGLMGLRLHPDWLTRLLS